MSYVVQSSENTIKVILNSQLATHGTNSNPKFTLKTPIETPYNQTGLVNLESLAMRAPSMFTKKIINHTDNSIRISSVKEATDAYLSTTDGDLGDNTDDVDYANKPDTVGQEDPGGFHSGITYGSTGVSGTTTENGVIYLDASMETHDAPPAEQSRYKYAFDLSKYDNGVNLYHKGLKAAFSKVDPDMFLEDTGTAGAPNYHSMRTMLISCMGLDMSIPSNVANLLFNIVNHFRIFDIVLPSLNNGLWNDADLVGVTTTQYQQVTLTYSSGVQLKINGVVQTSSSDTILTTLSAMLTNASHVVFNLAVPDTDSNKYTLKGPWLKLFGIEADEGNYHVISRTHELKCTLQTSGYDFVNMHTNFSRVVYAANQQSDDWQIVPTNIFWTVNIVSDCGKYTYYDNMSSSGKIPYTIPIMDEIEIYFTDKYGDIIEDIREFTCILAFDFSDKLPAKEPPRYLRLK